MESVIIKEKIVEDEDVKRTRWLQVEYFVSIINQILIGFVTIYLSWMCLRIRLKDVALHCWLCTIGFSFLMAEGVMTHYNGNTLLFSYTRKTRTTIHWVLQALGGAIGIAGGIVQMCVMKVHFVTLHGNLGFAAMILCAASMISGLSALFSRDLRKILAPLLNKSVHNLLGIATFVVALVAQFYGYRTGAFAPHVDKDFRYMIEVITIMSLVLSCFGPLISLFNKITNYFE